MINAIARPGESIDPFWGGTVRVIQKKRGYRFSVDAVLLAWFVESCPEACCLDLGTGCGILPLLLLRSAKCRRIVGLEIQEDLASIASRNAVLNGLADRFQVVRGDIRGAGRLFCRTSFDMLVCNPPYRSRFTGNLSPVKEKEIARHEVLVNLADLAEACTQCLSPGGCFYVIHIPERLEELQGLLKAKGCSPTRIRMVTPREGEAPNLVLVKAVRGESRGEPEKLPPVVMQTRAGDYTPEMERILRPDRYGTLGG